MLCEKRARAELAGLGSPVLGEWTEWSGTFHLRRRLSPAEQERVGPVLDVRGTDEARRRVSELPSRLRQLIPAGLLAEEVGSPLP